MLEVIYLIFNEGYSATAGDDWMRPALCEDALRLGRILAELAPQEPEVHGLVALMEIQASRAARARRPVGRAHPAARPEPRALGPAAHPPRPRRRSRAPKGSAARPARTRSRPPSPPATRGRATPEETDWARIAALYAALARLAPSPVVELNRAVAVAMAFGPAAGPRARRRADRRSRRCKLTTCCRACAATCSQSSAASTRPARSSSARPRSRETRASANCSGRVRPERARAGADACRDAVRRRLGTVNLSL